MISFVLCYHGSQLDFDSKNISGSFPLTRGRSWLDFKLLLELVHILWLLYCFSKFTINSLLKGPLPSASKNKYLLTVIDEYTRFPDAIPCPNISTEVVIKCLEAIFLLGGMPDFIHSDCGPSFMSVELTMLETEVLPVAIAPLIILQETHRLKDLMEYYEKLVGLL